MNEAVQVTSERQRKFSAGSFEGPLDLLWSLIRENKINIYDIPIAEITEQFLDYLDYAVELNLSDLSEFYSWASKLVCIKSRMLLPVEVRYDEDDKEEQERIGKENTLLRFLAFDNIAVDERKKLIDLGFVPGEELKILRDMKSGFITVLLKGGKIALDNSSASKILVKEV